MKDKRAIQVIDLIEQYGHELTIFAWKAKKYQYTKIQIEETFNTLSKKYKSILDEEVNS